MSLPTSRLALLNCSDILPLYDLIEDVTKDFVLKKCISKSGNTCYLVESSIENNTSLYNLLNNLDINGSVIDCRFVDDTFIFEQEEIITNNKIIKKIKNNVNKENKEETFLDINDKRFDKIYTDEDFFIDTSHNEYKKNGYLKYFIEEKRRRNN